MTNGEYTVISLMDPAVDRARMPVEAQLAYIRTRNPDVLAPYLIPGELPTVFHLREVKHAVWRSHVTGGGNDEDKCARAFQAALVRVENLRDDDGSVMRTWTPAAHANGVMTDEALEKINWLDIVEIGSVVLQKNPLRRGTDPTFAPPPSWFDTWARQESHRVAASLASLQATSSPASPEPAAATAPSSTTLTNTPSTGATSAVPTDVIAAAQSGVAA